VLLLILLLLTACDPWTFRLQQQTGWPIEGKIYREYRTVDIEGEDVLRVASPAGIAMRCVYLTDGAFNTEMSLEGESVTLRFRSTPYEDTVTQTGQFLDLVIGQHETVIRTRNMERRVACPLPMEGRPFKVHVVQHGRYVDAQIACVDLGRLTLDQPSTQWISVWPAEGARVELRDPFFSPITDEFTEGIVP
jgi:hypothetical protein